MDDKSTSFNIRLNVKELTGQQYYVTISSSATVLDLKQAVFEHNQIPVSRQRLIFGGKELDENKLISLDYNISDGRTIHLVVRKSFPSNINNNYGSINNSIPESHNIPISTDEQQPLNNDNEGVPFAQLIESGRAVKLIKLFSVIESVLLLLFAFYGVLWILISLPFAICGFIGAKMLNRLFLVLYCLFILASIGYRIYLAYYYSTWVMIVLTVISELLELYILKITLVLIKNIPRFSNHDQRVLRQMSTQWF